MTGSGEANLGDVRVIADAVVDLLAVWARRLRGARSVGARAQRARGLTAAGAPWRYTHGTEYGAIRMGAGPKARIGFDLAAIENRSATTSWHPETGEPARSRRPTTVPNSANLILRP